MELLVAIGHIGGSILAVFVLGIMVMLIASWETERNRKQVLEETAIKLGVTVDDLDSEELAPKLLQLSSDRFSSELLRNRLSDLCGAIRTMWGWLGSLLEVAVLIGVIWYTFTESKETAVYAWFIVAISLFFWIASVVFSLICRLLTGRYPGQAKQARRSLAEF